MNRKHLFDHPLRGQIASLTAAFALLALALCLPPISKADGEPERILIPEANFHAVSKSPEAGFEDDGTSNGRRFNFASFRGRVLGLWFKRKLFLERNFGEAAKEQTRAIEQLCEEMGVTQLDDIASALVHEGHGFLGEGNFEKARASFADALRFGPDLPDAHFGLALADWHRGGQTSAAAQEMFAGLKAMLRNQSLSSAVAGNLVLIALLVAAAMTVLFAVAMIVRYQRLVRHEVSEFLAGRYHGRFSTEGLQLAGWTVVLLPLLTWLFALWTPIYWLAATFRYQRLRERVVTSILLVMLVCAAPAMRSAEILLGLAADPGARLMLASTATSYDPEQIVTLEQKAGENPHDPAYRFLLGGMYARGRYFQEALAQYTQVIGIDPHSHRAVNNLGNLYLRMGRPEEALKCYKNAIGLNAKFLPAYYNSYLARKEMLQLREAEEVLKEAQGIDAKELARLIQESRTRTSGEPVDAVITREEVFRRILRSGSGQTGIASAFLSAPSLASAFSLLLALLLCLPIGGRPASRCVKCGDPFCHHCKVGAQGPEYCTQCQHMLIARDGLAPAIRREKTEQTERFRARQIRISKLTSLICPGMGRMLDGRTFSGVLISGIWCAALLSLFARPHLLQLPGTATEHPLFLVTVLLAVVGVTAWGLGNVRASRPRAAAGGWQWR